MEIRARIRHIIQTIGLEKDVVWLGMSSIPPIEKARTLHFLALTEQTNLKNDLLDLGLALARITLEMLQQTAPEESFFANSPMEEAEVDTYADILSRLDNAAALTREEKNYLMILALRYIPAKHGQIRLQSEFTKKILSARIYFLSQIEQAGDCHRHDETEDLAKERGFEVITGMFEGIDRHSGSLPDTHKQIVKLIASKDSGIILGGEVFGGKSAGELTNLIGFIIQNRMTVEGILTSQIGTHPLLTGPPTAYPLIKAAEVIAIKRHKCLC